MKKYLANTKEELKALVKDQSIYLGDIDTSKITDMSYLFLYSKRKDFSGIETWDVSNVETMEAMFARCYSFNQDISGWDVRNIKNMNSLFSGCYAFNQDISGWNTSSVENMA
ncbi:BspA family leucine-rich repeat surface protein, partial [Campylobacter jejuni]|uniref:BspA family leucine-rich repeat surface protein n=1 Tax=Campylobacter jejuni TaxID=197 RepID=UPI003B9CD281